MGLHTGEPTFGEESRLGLDVLRRGFAQTSRRRAPTRPVATKEDLERRIDEFVNRGLSSMFERFDLEKMESGRWLLKRRDDRTT